VGTLAPVRKDIQDKMIELFTQCDQDYGRRVAEGLKMASAKSSEKGRSAQAVEQAEQVSKEAKPY
jgi:catalase